MNNESATSTDSIDGAKRAKQFSLRLAFGLITLLSLWLASLIEPIMFDVALLVTTLLLIVRWCGRRRWALIAIVAIVPPAIAALSAPSILADPGLPTSEVKVELVWSSFVIGLVIALFLCAFLAAFVRRSFVVVSVIALAVCAASVAMHSYSVKYYYLNEIDYRWRMPGGASLRIESLRGVGRIYFHWKHARAKPALNHFRTGETTVFGQGGRVRDGRAFLTYIRSTRNEGDSISGRSLTLQLPYWTLAVASGILVIPWRRLVPDVRRSETSG